MSAERRCGTCKWWSLRDVKMRHGLCQYLLPEIPYVWEYDHSETWEYDHSETDVTANKYCSYWQPLSKDPEEKK